jgi:DNA topoisomerase-1
MNKDLIIVESPAKVKTIKKFLGKDYTVEASVGHVRDLPKKTLGVDVKDNFSPQYQITPGKEKVVDKLKKAAAKARIVYLAPDPDREGEAIAWHVAELIKEDNPNYKRIQFNEITSSAVQNALLHPRHLDTNLFKSQQARRVLDRLVGYKISPLLWQKVRRGISAGRVQSVALRLIVEREQERRAFTPQEYWVFKASLQGASPPPFEAELWKVKGKKPNIVNAQQAEELAEYINKASFSVSSIDQKKRQRHPKPPFITSSLQQDASNRLRFSAKKTMTLAQHLYEGVDLGQKGTTALITYMRTDSVRVSKEAKAAAKEWILSTLGQEYIPTKLRSYKSKGSSQDAHEAIRPVDVFLTPQDVKAHLSQDMLSLYTLIWQRFVASQMASATFLDTVISIQADETLWRTKGETVLFDGFLKIYSPEDAAKEIQLPHLEIKEALELIDLLKEQKFTQPPPRYTEASLVRHLEEKGIGRPSTYAQILSTLQDRDYVSLEKRQFLPTELGETVNNLLVRHFEQLMDVGFTAKMEGDLDKIAAGEKDWIYLLQSFYQEFTDVLQDAQANMAQVKTGMETEHQCELCNRPMVIKFGRNGAFLACSGYPECKNTKNFVRDKDGKTQIVEDQPQEAPKMGECPQCGSDLVLKKARTGNRFIACSNYPKCKYVRSYSTGVPCPQEGCNGELVEKSSRKGKVFYACNRYPDCTFALWNYPVQEECPQCGSKILVEKTTKTRGEHLSCPTKGCGYWRSLTQDPEKDVSTEES